MKAWISHDKAKSTEYFNRYKNGDESGLAYIYHHLYSFFLWKGMRIVKDEAIANCIVQEAFLRLWVVRDRIEDTDALMFFLKQQVKEGCSAFYRQASSRFHRQMLRLDDYENYDVWLSAAEEKEEEGGPYYEELSLERKREWEQIQAVLPNLPDRQQLFIKLCLRYSFSYDRIAFYLGGISDYGVARQVERTIENLKKILGSGQKLLETGDNRCLSFEGELNPEQAEILRMRYELQYGFEDIALALALSVPQVQRQFAEAFRKVKGGMAGQR